jgi:hypothetical protein
VEPDQQVGELARQRFCGCRWTLLIGKLAAQGVGNSVGLYAEVGERFDGLYA